MEGQRVLVNIDFKQGLLHEMVTGSTHSRRPLGKEGIYGLEVT